MAQEIADLIQVPCARVELAEFEGIRGSVARDVREAGEALVHGNEIIAGRVLGYDLKKRRKTSDHTFERIQRAIMEVCAGRCRQDLEQFAGYTILDGLVGNTDRHHENWGLLRRDSGGKATYRLAPSFDHASSLGREMQDSRRARILRENQVAAYLTRGQGGIYLGTAASALSPVALVREVSNRIPEAFTRWWELLENVTSERLDHIFGRVPKEWISTVQREFAKAVVMEGKSLLIRLRK